MKEALALYVQCMRLSKGIPYKVVRQRFRRNLHDTFQIQAKVTHQPTIDKLLERGRQDVKTFKKLMEVDESLKLVLFESSLKKDQTLTDT